MILDEQLAENLINKLSSLLNRKVMAFNLRGDVVASTDLAETNKNYDQVLEVIESGKELEILSTGPRKLHKGIVIPMCLSTETLGAIFIEDTPENYNRYSKIVRTTLELFLHQSITVDHYPYKDKIRDSFVFGLLNRQLAIGDTQIREAADLLDLRLSQDKIIIVITIKDFWQTLFGDNLTAAEDQKQIVLSNYKKAIYKAVSEFFINITGCTVAYFGSNTFVVMLDENHATNGVDMVQTIIGKSSDFQKILKTHLGLKFDHILVAIGNFYQGKDGPALAYEEACKALELGLKMGNQKEIYHIDDLGILATLAGGNTKWQSDFVKRLITKMTGQEYLLETVNVFFNNDMNITQTAGALKVHRNTLLYRLDKIKKISKLDPRVFNDAIELKVALILNQMLSRDNTTKAV